MKPSETTAAVQRYLDELRHHPGEDSAAPIVRDLLARAAQRLHLLCATWLHRQYPRLTRPPLNLETEEMLSAIVERLIKALRKARPGDVRQFFTLANQHMRWELNDLARRLDARPPLVGWPEDSVPAPAISDSDAGFDFRRILEAIEELPAVERETFSLVRIQGMTHAEAADLMSVSTKTIQRRLHLALLHLADRLGDLRLPPPSHP